MLLKIALVAVVLSAAPLLGANIGRHALGSAGSGPSLTAPSAPAVPAKPRRTGSVHYKNQSEPEIVTPSGCCPESLRSRVGQWI